MPSSVQPLHTSLTIASLFYAMHLLEILLHYLSPACFRFADGSFTTDCIV